MSLKSRDNKYYTSKRIILFAISFIFSYFLLITALAPTKYELKEGDISREDIKAPREAVDEQASDEKVKEAISKIDKQYTLKAEVKISAETNIKSLFDKVIALNATTLSDEEKVAELQKVDGTPLDSTEYVLLLSLSNNELKQLESDSLEIIDSIYEKNIEDENSKSLEDAKSLVNTKVNNLNQGSDISKVLKGIISNEVKPNFYFDKEKTEEKIKEVQKNTEKSNNKEESNHCSRR